MLRCIAVGDHGLRCSHRAHQFRCLCFLHAKSTRIRVVSQGKAIKDCKNFIVNPNVRLFYEDQEIFADECDSFEESDKGKGDSDSILTFITGLIPSNVSKPILISQNDLEIRFKNLTPEYLICKCIRDCSTTFSQVRAMLRMWVFYNPSAVRYTGIFHRTYAMKSLQQNEIQVWLENKLVIMKFIGVTHLLFHVNDGENVSGGFVTPTKKRKCNTC